MKFIINENNLIKGFNNFMDYEFSKLLKFNRIPTRPSSIFFTINTVVKLFLKLIIQKKPNKLFLLLIGGFLKPLIICFLIIHLDLEKLELMLKNY